MLEEKLKKELDGLSASQLKEVKDYLSLLIQSKASDTRSGLRPSQKLTRDENLWLDSLHLKLSEATGISSSNPLVASGHDRTRTASFELAEAFLKDAGIWQKESYARKAVYDLLAGLLVAYAKQVTHKLKIPLGMKFVLQNTDKLPELFDLAYPGYLQSGLARMVIAGHLNPPPKE